VASALKKSEAQQFVQHTIQQIKYTQGTINVNDQTYAYTASTRSITTRWNLVNGGRPGHKCGVNYEPMWAKNDLFVTKKNYKRIPKAKTIIRHKHVT